MAHVEFFFDLSSPWTRLAFHNIQPIVRETGARSCPIAWCNCDGGAIVISGVGRIGQAVMIGRLTRGSSLKTPMVSRVM